VGDHLRENLQHVVAGQRGANAEHHVNEQEFGLRKRPGGPGSPKPLIQHQKHQEGKNDVEEKGDGGRVARIAHQLHLDDPVGVKRD